MTNANANGSNRELAKVLGVSEGAIRKAEKAGRIQREPDGSWNPSRVRSQWGINTDPAKQRSSSRIGMEPVPEAAINPVRETLQETSQQPGSGGTYMQARTADMVVRAQMRKLDLEERKKSLGSKEEYNGKIFKWKRQERDMMLNWPSRIVPEMAAELAVDPHLLQKIMEREIRTLLSEIAEIPFSLD